MLGFVKDRLASTAGMREATLVGLFPTLPNNIPLYLHTLFK